MDSSSEVSQAATKLAIRRYMGQIWQQRRFTIPTLLLVGVGATLTFYVPPLVVAAVLNHFNGLPPTLEALVPFLLLFGGIWFVGEVLWRVAFLCLQRAEVRALHNLYSNALDELNKKDITFFHNNFAGSLTKKSVSYSKSFEGFFDTITFNIVANVLPLLFAAVILWRFSPWLPVALVLLIGLTLLMLVPLIRKRKRLVEVRETANNHMVGHMADVIGNMDAVQAFAHGGHEMKRHRQNVDDYMKKTLRSWDYHALRIDAPISPIYVLINVTGLALAVMLSNDTATLTAIFVTFNYFAYATKILWEFNRTYRNIENAIAEASQFTELLLTPSAIQDPKEPKPFTVSKGAVNFKDVHFAYDGQNEQPLFADLNLHIQPGEKIALVGHSGGGKTTITKLLLRFVDVTEGELLIDGQNIAHSRLADIRAAIAYVPQEPVMFHRSIRENIRYGKLDASDDEVITAAKRANAHEFIIKLPHGYDTMVGERGVKLSGGQRQRVAIARAIIKDAPILVLDEATSALDSDSEKLIQAALWKLMQGRTAIVIAHRLSTIQRMDRIVVLENGKIAEEGNHQALLKHGGVYAKLWAHQSGGFIEE
jgi:ATP-binding cassette, subfamily B, bacterial